MPIPWCWYCDRRAVGYFFNDFNGEKISLCFEHMVDEYEWRKYWSNLFPQSVVSVHYKNRICWKKYDEIEL